MTDSLAKLFAQALVPANLAAQQKSYVTYTAPFSALGAPEVTLLEARSLLASSGTTGLRTWEAALLLGKYLMSSDGRKFVQNSNVLELGAGTGFLSIICAKHLNAQQVLATDGNRGVIDGLELNADINGLELRGVINPVVFKWGHSLIDVLDVRQESRSIDLVLGADVVGIHFLANGIAKLLCLCQCTLLNRFFIAVEPSISKNFTSDLDSMNWIVPANTSIDLRQSLNSIISLNFKRFIPPIS